jgi:hypothetical protein
MDFEHVRSKDPNVKFRRFIYKSNKLLNNFLKII